LKITFSRGLFVIFGLFRDQTAIFLKSVSRGVFSYFYESNLRI
jgi:hypothetical protein